MAYRFDKDEIKSNLSLEQVFDVVAELGGEPTTAAHGLVCATICHNKPGEGSHKLYYYENSHLFRCFTACGESFDIFELIIKAKEIQDRITLNLYQATLFIANKFGLAPNVEIDDDLTSLEDWQIFNAYERIKEINSKQEIVLREYSDDILTRLPRPKIVPWLEEGITQEVIDFNKICYEGGSGMIVIPHYDVNSRLIGIRGRVTAKEDEKRGKYKPLRIGEKLYNHPLGYNLFNLNHSKNNIKTIEKAIVFEGEKSVYLYQSYFGLDNDISVAVCGSALLSYQVDLLIEQGAKEIIVAFDKQYQTIGDEEFKKLTKHLKQIHKKYSKFITISFMFDKEGLLGYKDSPIDQGPEIFLELFKKRIFL